MNYVVIGAGGVGGSVSAQLIEGKKNVSLIARGKHLREIQLNGLQMETDRRGKYGIYSIEVSDMENYSGNPDVIFVCVKGYSLEEAIPFISSISSPGTVVIPLLSIYGTGDIIRGNISTAKVCDGYPQLSAYIRKPGTICIKSSILRVTLGMDHRENNLSSLSAIAADLNESGIETIISEDIRKDSLWNYFYNSALSLCCLYYRVRVGNVQRPSEYREMFIALTKETTLLGDALGFPAGPDFIENGLAFLNILNPDTITQLQRDINNGKTSELDNLIFAIINMASEKGVSMPKFSKCVNKLTSPKMRILKEKDMMMKKIS